MTFISVRPFRIFVSIADSAVVMIFRVYAMWSQSRIILIVLLLIYVPGVTLTFITMGIYLNPDTRFSGMSCTKLKLSG